MNTDKNQTLTEVAEPKIQLLDKGQKDLMDKWYDQQIGLAKKRAQLAQLHAEIAESKFKESLAYAKIAQLAGPDPETTVTQTETDQTEQSAASTETGSDTAPDSVEKAAA